ncbi:MAG: FtsB family cell division protein [Saccharofermentanales bacterium]
MSQRQAQSSNKNQRRTTPVFLLRFFVGISAIIILALCFSTFLKQQNEFAALSKERRRLEKERDELADDYEMLKNLNEMADSDIYIEHIARQYLDMVRPGEFLIIE